VATAQGVRIDEIEPFGPARLSGLAVGDVIVVADGRAVRDEETMIALITSRSPGQALPLLVKKGGKGAPDNVVVIVGERGGAARLAALYALVVTPVAAQTMTVQQASHSRTNGVSTNSVSFTQVTVSADGSRLRDDSFFGDDKYITTLLTADGAYVWIDQREKTYWAVPAALASREQEFFGIGLIPDGAGWRVDAPFTATGNIDARESQFVRRSKKTENGMTTALDITFVVPRAGGSSTETWILMQQARVGDVGGRRYPALWNNYRQLAFVPNRSSAIVEVVGRGARSEGKHVAEFSPIGSMTVDESAFTPPREFKRIAAPDWAMKK
jgi:hypothetical protein